MRFGAEIIHFYVESGVSGCGKHRGKQEIRRITHENLSDRCKRTAWS